MIFFNIAPRRKLGVALIIGLIASFNAIAQNNEKEKVKQTLALFFEAISEQDSSKFLKTVDLRGQLYYTTVNELPSQYNMNTFKAVINGFSRNRKWQETAYNYDIKLRPGLALAWVTYDFLVDDEFSHCGVDTFTLLKADKQWRIVNVAFTRETEDCESLLKSH